MRKHLEHLWYLLRRPPDYGWLRCAWIAEAIVFIPSAMVVWGIRDLLHKEDS